ncbi:Uncharacterised protein [uncultured archaeon]|nr:Uncharacterised protein [uncultured archaeon]
MDDFLVSLAVSAVVIAVLMFSSVGGAITPLFALALLAVSQVGFFALKSFSKAGIKSPSSEYIYILMVFVCFFASALAFGALSALLPLMFVPIVFCAPAVAAMVHGYFS